MKDVEKALTKYKEDGCGPVVPEFLRRMRLINGPYYQERFLRYLLSPSNHDNTDIRNLIGALEQYVAMAIYNNVIIIIYFLGKK